MYLRPWLTHWCQPSLLGAFVVVSLCVMLPRSVRAEDPLTDEEVAEIAIEAYYYAYPVVLMDVSRQNLTNTEISDPANMLSPVNQFGHVPAFPDATFTDVVRANADTLYSSLWFDVSEEALVIHVPDSGGRYYLLPMIDMWTDVFASPGKRTTGTAEQTFAIVGPGWQGELPPDVDMIRSPTAVGWMIGRTQTDGKADYASVHAFQSSLTAVPLSPTDLSSRLQIKKVSMTPCHILPIWNSPNWRVLALVTC